MYNVDKEEDVLDYEILGKNVRRYRLMKSLTQCALAETINCTEGYIGQIERAKSKPALSTAVDLANALDVTVDDLLVENYLKPELVYFKEISDIISKYTLEKRIMLCQGLLEFAKFTDKISNENI